MTFYPLFGNKNDLNDELRKIGCDEKAISILNKKFDIFPIKIIGMKPALANIIKQEMISCKGDAVVHAKSISCAIDKTDVLLLGTDSIYQNFFKKMEYQNSPYLIDMAKQLKKMIEYFHSRIPSQSIKEKKKIDYSKPVIMGILNITKDSFYDGGKYLEIDKALNRCEEMITEGADIIDIGAESSRPGAEPVTAEEELEKIAPLVEKISKNMYTIISVDTTKSQVADEALKAGADIINDISGLRFDEKMAGIIQKHQALVVIMHMKGTPKDMQKEPFYEDVVRELVEYFDERIDFALNSGIIRNNIIIDPGIGFGKRLEDNKAIIKNLSSFRKYGLPILIGASRKSMIGMLLDGIKDKEQKTAAPEKRLYGTLGIHAASYLQGADIFRVHDVKEHYEMLNVIHSIK